MADTFSFLKKAATASKSIGLKLLLGSAGGGRTPMAPFSDAELRKELGYSTSSSTPPPSIAGFATGNSNKISFEYSKKAAEVVQLQNENVGIGLANRIARNIDPKNQELAFQQINKNFDVFIDEMVRVNKNFNNMQSAIRKTATSSSTAIKQITQNISTVDTGLSNLNRNVENFQREFQLLKATRDYKREYESSTPGLLAEKQKNNIYVMGQSNAESGIGSSVDKAIGAVAGAAGAAAVSGTGAASLAILRQRLAAVLGKLSKGRALGIIVRYLPSLGLRGAIGAISAATGIGTIVSVLMAASAVYMLYDLLAELEKAADEEGPASTANKYPGGPGAPGINPRGAPVPGLPAQGGMLTGFSAIAANIQTPDSFGQRTLPKSKLTFGEKFDRQMIEMQKSQFMKFGQLPPGFEFLPGHMGRLGQPEAVAARGAMPLGGYAGFGGVPGAPMGGYGGGGSGYTPNGGTTNEGTPNGGGPATGIGGTPGPGINTTSGGIVEPGQESSTGAWKRRVNVPKNLGPASVRYNNPGAAYPSKYDEKFGIEGYGIIGGGHKIGKFPTVVHGAAANFDLWRRGYVGMTLQQAVNKWRGGNGSLNVPEGFDPNMKLNQEILNNKDFMVQLFKGMSKHEAGRKVAITDDQWSQAYDMFKAGGIEEYKRLNPDIKPTPVSPNNRTTTKSTTTTMDKLASERGLTGAPGRVTGDKLYQQMEINLPGLDKTFIGGSGSKTTKNPATPEGLYPLGPIRRTKLGLVVPFGKSGAESYTEKDFGKQVYDPVAKRYRGHMEFHQGFNSKLTTKGCISINPKQYNEQFIPHLAELQKKHGQLYLFKSGGQIQIITKDRYEEALKQLEKGESLPQDIAEATTAISSGKAAPAGEEVKNIPDIREKIVPGYNVAQATEEFRVRSFAEEAAGFKATSSVDQGATMMPIEGGGIPLPTTGKIGGQPLDPRPYRGGTHSAAAIDIGGPTGTPIISPANGTVVRSYVSSSHAGKALNIEIQGPDGNIYELRNYHLHGFAEGLSPEEVENARKTGKPIQIKAGQVIGYMGGTGVGGKTTFGSHLHVETHRVYYDKNGNRKTEKVNPNQVFGFGGQSSRGRQVESGQVYSEGQLKGNIFAPQPVPTEKSQFPFLPTLPSKQPPASTADVLKSMQAPPAAEVAPPISQVTLPPPEQIPIPQQGMIGTPSGIAPRISKDTGVPGVSIEKPMPETPVPPPNDLGIKGEAVTPGFAEILPQEPAPPSPPPESPVETAIESGAAAGDKDMQNMLKTKEEESQERTGATGPNQGSSGPSNGGKYNPESQSAEPGSGGYGSYGRCFV